MRLVYFAGSLMLCACASAKDASQSNPLNRSVLVLTFEETFAKFPSFYDPINAASGRWKTNFAFGIQDPSSKLAWQTRTLRPNAELQYYGDPTAGTGSVEWKPGSLALIAQSNPYRADPRTNAMPYLSALITTQKSFQQRYGYFEARITMPVGKGLWPAFWLLPAYKMLKDPSQPQPQQEIDVMENIGKNGEYYATVHHAVGAPTEHDGEQIEIDRVDEPHDYGVLLTSAWIVWYLDQHEVRRRANTDFHDEAYMLLNLAVGGQWPGSPDAATPFPARMTVHRVRAYALKAGYTEP